TDDEGRDAGQYLSRNAAGNGRASRETQSRQSGAKPCFAGLLKQILLELGKTYVDGMHPGCNDVVSAVDGRSRNEALRDGMRIDIGLELVKILYWVGSTLGKSTEGCASRHQQDRLQ